MAREGTREGTRWRLNPRLRIAHQRAEGRPVVVLHDPATDDYFQVGADEFAVAQSFDGDRDLDTVQSALVAAGMPIERDELESFVLQLAESGLLERVDGGSPDNGDGAGNGATADDPSPAAVETLAPRDPTPVEGAASPAPAAGAPSRAAAEPITPPTPQPRPSTLSRLLQLEIAAVQAGDFFLRNVRWVRPFYSTPAMVVAAVAVVLAGAVTVARFGELEAGVRSMFNARSLVGIWIVYGAIVLVHELAHGFTCAYFGGRPGALGFLLMYGKPCATCDVSDAWMLPKSQRLWIMAAGSVFELVTWAFATLCWRVAAPETLVHHVALIALTICGIGTLFNFNPLIRFDGYYMLSDWLEIPNLRQRAFTDLKRRLFGQPPLAATSRERRVFLAYGIVAVIYTVLLVGFLVVRLHGAVASHWGIVGVVALWGAVAVFAARPLHGFLAEWAASVVAKKNRHRLWAAIGLGLLAALVLVRWPLKVSSECRLEPRAQIVVRSPLDGTVETVRVREGDVVDSGAPLLQLATRDLDFALAVSRAEMEELVARLALLESGPRREEVELAERRVAETQTRVRFLSKEHERARASHEGDLVPVQAVEAAERELRLAEDEAAASSKSMDLLRAGARPEEVRAMRAKLESVRAAVARLEDERNRTAIVAPFQGQVLSSETDRLVGRYVERGDSLLLLADFATMWIEIPVPEKEVGDVVVGAPVRFKARTHPGRTFEGRVVGIAPAAEVGERQRTVLVRSELDNRDGVLRAGTSGYAKIYCGERTLGGLLLRKGVRSMRTEFWALW